MAYLQSLDRECGHSACARRASERLFTNYNEVFGDYCARHAKAAWRQRSADEATEAARTTGGGR